MDLPTKNYIAAAVQKIEDAVSAAADDLDIRINEAIEANAAIAARLDAILAALARERHHGDEAEAAQCPDVVQGRPCTCMCHG